MKSLVITGFAAFALAACSQPPAKVTLKGDRFYGPEGLQQYAQHSSGPGLEPAGYAQSAPADSVQIAELSAPEPQITAQPIAAPEPIMVSNNFQPPAPVAVSEAQPVQLAPLPEIAAAPIASPEPEKPKMNTVSFVASAAAAEPPVKQELAPLPIEQVASSHPIAQAAIAEQAKGPAPKLTADRNSNFIWPVEGKIVSHFGPKKNGLVNDGINIAAREGEPIWAAAKGEVVYSGNELKGYGNMVILRHDNGWMTAYAHASDMLVKKGDTVEQGDLLGYVGKTGAVNTAQLHFGIREGKNPVDPETLLPQRVASAQ